MVDRTLISQYAKKNTSPKVPLESLMVRAFLDSLMNSTSIEILYENLKKLVTFNPQFTVFLSYHDDCKMFAEKTTSGLGFYRRNQDTGKYDEIVTPIPFMEIIAYSMLKKDLFLFEMISKYLFSGRVNVYSAQNDSGIIVTTTDQLVHYTDLGTTIAVTDNENITTDMSPGKLRLGLFNYYTSDGESNYLNDASRKKTVQTKTGLLNAMELFYKLIPIVAPARLGLWVCFVPIVQIVLEKTSDGYVIKKDAQGKFVSKSCTVIAGDTSNKIKISESNYSSFSLYEYNDSERDFNLGQRLEFYTGDVIHTNPWIERESGITNFCYEVNYNPYQKYKDRILGHVRFRTDSQNDGYIGFDVNDVIEQRLIASYHLRLEICITG